MMICATGLDLSKISSPKKIKTELEQLEPFLEAFLNACTCVFGCERVCVCVCSHPLFNGVRCSGGRSINVQHNVIRFHTTRSRSFLTSTHIHKSALPSYLMGNQSMCHAKLALALVSFRDASNKIAWHGGAVRADV